jgi:hypothetical protein
VQQTDADKEEEMIFGAWRLEPGARSGCYIVYHRRTDNFGTEYWELFASLTEESGPHLCALAKELLRRGAEEQAQKEEP